MKYRPEIDGMRALAVLPVILFHAGFNWFSGGYIGVDVFFVISGYLVTTILIEDIEQKRLSITNFYIRRARRILPALLFVMLVCLPFAWLWMLPYQMEDFSESVISVLLFVSNFYFISQGGYFGSALEEIPLLHTWTLAIEIQYYILFPIFLLLAWRIGQKKVFWAICGFALLSLIAAEMFSRYTAGRTNFFFTPTRAWELLAGAIAAFILYKRSVYSSSLLALLGVVAIVFAVFMYDETTPFPSAYTLLPVIGTVLFILFAGKETLAAKLLSTKILVGIGLISYSAYLWHQPLFVFARLKLLEEPSQFLMGFLSILSLALGYISWKVIENPFRDRKIMNNFQVISVITVAFVCLIIVGAYGDRTQGYKNLMLRYKYPTEMVELYNTVLPSIQYDMYDRMFEKDCRKWVRDTKDIDDAFFQTCVEKYGQAVIVLGDSHAMNLYNIIAKNGAIPFILGVAQGDCRPADNHEYCHYSGFEKFLQKNSEIIKGVIYHQSGSYFIKDKRGQIDSHLSFIEGYGSFSHENIKVTLAYLENLSKTYDVQTLWIGPFLEFRYRPENVFFSHKINSVNPISVHIFKDLEPVIKESVASTNLVKYESFQNIFFEPKQSFFGDCFVFRDGDHYSECGEQIIAEQSNIDLLNEKF